jgi:hypothetical protein
MKQSRIAGIGFTAILCLVGVLHPSQKAHAQTQKPNSLASFANYTGQTNMNAYSLAPLKYSLPNINDQFKVSLRYSSAAQEPTPSRYESFVTELVGRALCPKTSVRLTVLSIAALTGKSKLQTR